MPKPGFETRAIDPESSVSRNTHENTVPYFIIIITLLSLFVRNVRKLLLSLDKNRVHIISFPLHCNKRARKQ